MTMSGCNTFAYTVNRTIQYGIGSTNEALPKLLKRFDAKKAMIICGKSLATKTQVIKSIETILGDAHATTFHDISQHAPVEAIERALKIYKDCGADLLISVGGGSPIDSTKAMSYWHHEQVGSFINHIAIPTTLSAAEFTALAGFTKDGKKTGVSDPELAPTAVILDAKYTLDTPERLWLSTGLRALDHAVESLYRPYAPPLVQELALSAIHDLFELLPLSKSSPGDLDLRQRLQIAAWHSLFPYQQEEDKKSALGLSHALGYMLGAPYSIAHGMCSAITLGPTVRYKASRVTAAEKTKFTRALQLVGRQSSGEAQRDMVTFGDAVDDLVKNLSLGDGLLELGLPSEQELTKVCKGAGLNIDDSEEMIRSLKAKL